MAESYRQRLVRVGNSTGLTLPRDVLTQAELKRGDAVRLEVKDGRIEISKDSDAYNDEMQRARAIAARYRRAMAGLAK